MIGLQITNLERGIPEGRAASHGSEGNSSVVESTGGLRSPRRGVRMQHDTQGRPRNLGDPRPLAVDETAEYAQRNEPIGAESGREAEVGGPNTSDDDGELVIAPRTRKSKGAPVRGRTSRREP